MVNSLPITWTGSAGLDLRTHNELCQDSPGFGGKCRVAAYEASDNCLNHLNEPALLKLKAAMLKEKKAWRFRGTE